MLTATACAAPFRSRVEIPRDDLQQRVERRFPLEKKVMFARIALEEPSVILTDKSDRIGLAAQVRLDGPGLREKGSVAVDGKLRYDGKERLFYLDDAKVVELDMPHLSPRHRPAVERVSTALLASYLEQTPIYELEKSSSLGAKMFLRKVKVKDGRVIAEMGL